MHNLFYSYVDKTCTYEKRHHPDRQQRFTYNWWGQRDLNRRSQSCSLLPYHLAKEPSFSAKSFYNRPTFFSIRTPMEKPKILDIFPISSISLMIQMLTDITRHCYSRSQFHWWNSFHTHPHTFLPEAYSSPSPQSHHLPLTHPGHRTKPLEYWSP